jgi:hypothetical protein
MSHKNRVNISSQKPVIRAVLQEAIESVRVSLLFDDAFPNAEATAKVVQTCVIEAAKKFKPATSLIHERLVSDDQYLSKMASVVRNIFSNKYLTELNCSPVLAFR